MNAQQDKPAEKEDPNKAFYEKSHRAIRDLFDKAKVANELHFVMGMMPEFRGAQDGGWNTAEEAIYAYDQFTAHIKSLNKDDPVRIRIALAFYLNVAEGSGFYEMPKKMMLTIEGRGNNLWPFQSLVKKHEKTGRAIDPNANTIMKNMMGHAYDLGLHELSDVFKEAFDSDVRNAVAHADYIIAADGLRLRKRNGGQARVIPWDGFDAIFCRGINLFHFIRQIVDEYVHSYDPPKVIRTRMNKNEPLSDYTLYYIPDTGAFGFKTGGR
jgi:hypothetical protein